jgi:GNAT superfamily N-acetyltransferase
MSSWEERTTHFTILKGRTVAARCAVIHQGTNWASLEEVITHQDYRRQGLATEVCKNAIEWAHKQGWDLWVHAAPIWPEKGPEAEVLKTFYERLGFTLTDERPGRYFLEYRNPALVKIPALTY